MSYLLLLCFFTPSLEYVVKQHIPQARQEGWRHKYEYPKYYTPNKLSKVLHQVRRTAILSKLEVYWILAVAIEQSRLQVDATRLNRNGSRDIGLLQINCGRSSPFCYTKRCRRGSYGCRRGFKIVYKKVAKQLGIKDLYTAEDSATAFIYWLTRKRAFCRVRRTKLCRLNKRLHGVAVPMHHPHKTRRIYRNLKRAATCLVQR